MGIVERVAAASTAEAHAIYKLPTRIKGEFHRKTPFGWPAVNLEPGGSLHLQWGPIEAPSARLRITMAGGVHEEKLVAAIIPTTGQTLGTFDVRYSALFQPFEVVVDFPNIIRHDLELRQIKGETPLSLFAQGQGLPPALSIHVLIETNGTPLEHFFARLASSASIQLWTWTEGCVLDGLLALDRAFPGRFAAGLQSHLNLYLNPQNQVQYQSSVRSPRGIESTLLHGVIAQLDSQHPILESVVDFWLSHRNEQGVVVDDDLELGGGHKLPSCITAEGAYTVAYPMMVIAQQRRDAYLAELALHQLRIRRDALVMGDDLYLRAFPDGSKTHRNWGRGYAWYMLGLIKTLLLAPDHPDLVAEFQRISAIVMRLQQDNGLWPCFLGEPDSGDETSGSVGIAAALALGADMLPPASRQAAIRTATALENRLTPDGFLTGVTQGNRTGEALQRSGYRVIYQFSMGLMAQLLAALFTSHPK